MLNTSAQILGDTLVLHCHGRIVIGEAYRILRNEVVRQKHSKTVVLDLAGIDRIDAGGLGVLLDIRNWAHSRGTRFKLMNVMNHVDFLLELTRLNRVFEFCSIKDVFDLLHPARTVMRWSEEENRRPLEGNCTGTIGRQDAPSVAKNVGPFAAHA